jgi:Heterokaryon incompatibility protein (HET)
MRWLCALADSICQSVLLSHWGGTYGAPSLAVSCCWQQPDEVKMENEWLHGYRIQTAAGIRSSRVPVNILRRAISYAALRDIKAIWIDQVCIAQDDPIEKATHIQEIDRIFSTAQQVVVILNCKVVDQSQAALFEDCYKQDLAVEKFDFIHPHKSDGLDFFQNLISDSWFSRAWTIQESIVARNRVHYLLPCTLGLPRPSWMGSMPDQIILDQAIPSDCLDFLPNFPNRANIKSLCSQVLEYPEYKHPALPFFEKRDYTTHRLGSLNAFKRLRNRALTEPIDRIAIIANVCRYKIRLHARMIHSHQGLRYETAVYVQALLNGKRVFYWKLEVPNDPRSWILLP